MRTVLEIQQHLPPSVENGLAAGDVALSRQRFGANKLTPLPREPLWKKFLDKFDEPIIKILLAAALLSMFVDLFQVTPVIAGIAIGVVAVIAVGLFALKRAAWLPTLLFVSAVVLFFLGLL